MKRIFLLSVFLVGLGTISGCARFRPPSGVKPYSKTMLATGYCKCGKCCNWERNWRFQAVFKSGPLKGKVKKIGITANGTKARKGTIAADTRKYPFGTIMYIEGYGYGRVEDRGGAIKGEHIDLFFRTHKQALEWGKQNKRVKIWLPK
jgi:3D (Asp-Asp-Asp) domain-containing protein